MTVTVLQVLSWEARAECARCDRFVLRVVSEGAALDAARGGNPRDAVRSIVLRDALAEGFRRVLTASPFTYGGKSYRITLSVGPVIRYATLLR